MNFSVNKFLDGQGSRLEFHERVKLFAISHQRLFQHSPVFSAFMASGEAI